MNKVMLGLVLVISAVFSTPAYADNEPCKKGDCSGQQGDCRNVEEGGYCEDNDLSPTFDKSPVQDSFNIGPVCLPMSTCNFDGQKERPPEQQPTAFPPDTPLLCPPIGVPPLAPHCDPKPHGQSK